VFALNHRATPRFQFPAPLDDVRRAIRFIRYHADQYRIDPRRIGVLGGSSGGHLALLLGTMDGMGEPDDPDPVNRVSSSVQAVVAWYPPSDLGSIGDALRPQVDALLVGPSTTAPAMPVDAQIYRDASPITYVSVGDPPTLLVHGDADATVPFQQSVALIAVLERAGVESEFLHVPGGGHGPAALARAPNPPDYIGATVGWFNEHLR
jgi:acetyl esterase/lipase